MWWTQISHCVAETQMKETKAANSSRQLKEYKSLKSTATIHSDQLG